MSTVDIQNISFAYKGTNLFSDVSARFENDEFCALIGPNGSGKTTLLKCISGLLPLASGQILINGKNLTEFTPRELAQIIAYVPQFEETVFDISVYDVVMMGRNPYQKQWKFGSEQDDAVVNEMLERCNLSHLRDRLLSELSGGERQRTLIARAMAQQTSILLLDEPLANLDITHRFEIMDILERLNREQHVLILLIIHDFPIAMKYVHHAMLMKQGKILLHDVKNAVLTPENFRNCFDLGIEYQINEMGLITLDKE